MKYVHLLGNALFLGGITTASICRYSACSMTNPADMAMILGVGKKAVPLVAVGLILIIISGCTLVDHEFSFSDAWVIGALCIVGYMLVIGMVAGKADRLTRELAERESRASNVESAMPGIKPSAELTARLMDPVAGSLNISMIVAIIIILALMVWKPK